MRTEQIARKNAVGSFTKIELVIVLAIILVLGAIAVPNFLESTPRPKISRLKADMRSLATGIEAYFVDNNVYPLMHPLRDFAPKPEALKEAGGWDLMTIEPGNVGIGGLTTPIAYVTSLFPDVTSPDGKLPYAYHADRAGWIVFSPGRDGKYDIDPTKDYDGSTTQPSVRLLQKSYDPTNGLGSAGDVWRIRQ